MRGRIVLEHDTPSVEENYTWNSLWVKDYESPWSIIEKFKYANCITSKDFLRTFGTDQLISLKILSLSFVNANLVTMERLDDNKLNSVLKVPLKEHAKQIIQILKNRIPHNKLIKDNFTYCKICIRNGYHSIFHQCRFLNVCPFHPHARLHDSCPSCNRKFKYSLNDELTSFTCKCGNKLFNSQKYHLVWTKYAPEIKYKPLIDLLNLTTSEIVNLKKIKYIHLDENESDLCFLEAYLSFLNPEIEPPSYLDHKSIMSHKNLFLYGNKLKEYQEAFNIGDRWTFDKIDYEVDEEIYKSSIFTYSAVCSHLRQTVLRNHIHCLMELSSGNIRPVCPYAYAYLNWRVCIEGMRDHSQVFRSYYRKRRPQAQRGLETISVIDTSIFEKLRVAWGGTKSHNEDNRYKSVAATKWIVNHLLYTILINHFNNWLEFASKKKYLHNGKIYLYYKNPFKYKGLPLLAFVQHNNQITLHMWKNTKVQRMVLNCPYRKR